MENRVNNILDNLCHVSRRRQQSFNCRTKPQRAESFNEKGPRPLGPRPLPLGPWAHGPWAPISKKRTGTKADLVDDALSRFD